MERKTTSIERQLNDLQERSQAISKKLDVYYSELKQLQAKHHYNDLSTEQRRLENDIYTLNKARVRERTRELLEILSHRIDKHATTADLNAWLKRNAHGLSFVTNDPYGLVTSLLHLDLDNYIATKHAGDPEIYAVTYGQERIVVPDTILRDLNSFRALCERTTETNPIYDMINDLSPEQRQDVYKFLKAEFESFDPNSESD